MNHFTKKKKKKQIHFFMYMKNGLNKLLALLPRTEKFLSGSTISLAYTDHIIQFGLNTMSTQKRNFNKEQKISLSLKNQGRQEKSPIKFLEIVHLLIILFINVGLLI